MVFSVVSVYGLVYVGGCILFTAVMLFYGTGSVLDRLNAAIYIAIFTIVGGRLGYVFFYEPQWYSAHFLEICMLYKGGMSFHGAVIGAVIGAYCFGHRRGRFLRYFDILAICAVVMLPLGRLCNFFNGEAFGRPSDLPWAVIFTNVDLLPRHPSQIYEALAEGPFCAGVLFFLWQKNIFKYAGQCASVFICCYSVVRFLIEFTREPDFSIGYLWAGLTLGQYLCLLLFGAGCCLWWYVSQRKCVPEK